MPPPRLWWRYALYPIVGTLFVAVAAICVAIDLALDPLAAPKDEPRWD